MTIFDKINKEDYKVDVLQNFFNAIDDGHFIEYLGNMAAKVSFGDEYRYCTFANDIDPVEDEAFEGVKIEIVKETVIYSEDEFKQVLLEACNLYTNRIPESSVVVEKEITKIRNW